MIDIRFAADGSVRLRADVPSSGADLAALHAAYQLPGNLRFAYGLRGSELIADTQINGAAHLPRTLEWLRAGICQALHAQTPALCVEHPDSVAVQDVAEALAQMPWAADGVVTQEDNWELRPRLRGEVVPVRLVREPSAVRISRRVVPLPDPATSAAWAVAHQALRFNDQLWHARLAACGGQLVAETRLHGGLIAPGWLSQAAYAVAEAERHASAALRILATEPQVADTYQTLFCSTVERPA